MALIAEMPRRVPAITETPRELQKLPVCGDMKATIAWVVYAP